MANHDQGPYVPLPTTDRDASDATAPIFSRKNSLWLASFAIISVLILVIVALITGSPWGGSKHHPSISPGQDNDPCSINLPALPFLPSRDVLKGVSDQSSSVGLLGHPADCPYSWTNDVLSWQRTWFHFQPQRNWMNNPNGPLFYNGWYHLFYQYNPDSAVWGNITWGHAVSKGLTRWLHLPLAMVADQ